MKSIHPFLRITLKFLLVFSLFAGVVWMVRKPLMLAVGSYLIQEDELQQCEAIFMLSGNPEARAAEVAKLLKSAYAPKVVCTGANIPDLFLAFDMNITEAELSVRKLEDEGVRKNQIEIVPAGTSTREESGVVLEYCRMMGLKKVMVVSDRFHTNRIDYAFRSDFEKAGIELVLRGAPAIAYSENMWWANEHGLLMVNNEYVKLFYYFLKY